ncbi:MAG: HAMP domain-containing histidine kinase [Bradyrhizobium sp.]|nr:HAMP domain-containing histidine kinase [Bradyrhizobium sp.]
MAGSKRPAQGTDLELTTGSVRDTDCRREQFADMGHCVSHIGPRHAMAMARPDDLARGVTNLVENAVRFGGDVVLGLTVAGERITIEVADDGPGISDAHKAAMLEPFVRGDGARNMDDATGFGLALAIAQAIALAHGGELSLHDREPHGPVARLRFPQRPERERQAA